MKKELATIIEKIKHLEPLTSDEKKMFIDYSICRNHTGKMTGIGSISTNCLDNPFCNARKEHAEQNNIESICLYCFATAMLNRYGSLSEKLTVNFIFYTFYELSPEDVPQIEYAYFRFEAFGDIANMTQVNNYMTIASCNKHTRFALWSKNISFMDRANKPKNVSFVYSIETMNGETITADYIERFKAEHPNIDHVFIVYDKEYAKEHHISINCGGRNCLGCLRCYYRRQRDYVVRELKK